MFEDFDQFEMLVWAKMKDLGAFSSVLVGRTPEAFETYLTNARPAVDVAVSAAWMLLVEMSQKDDTP